MALEPCARDSCSWTDYSQCFCLLSLVGCILRVTHRLVVVVVVVNVVVTVVGLGQTTTEEMDGKRWVKFLKDSGLFKVRTCLPMHSIPLHDNNNYYH